MPRNRTPEELAAWAKEEAKKFGSPVLRDLDQSDYERDGRDAEGDMFINGDVGPCERCGHTYGDNLHETPTAQGGHEFVSGPDLYDYAEGLQSEE